MTQCALVAAGLVAFAACSSSSNSSGTTNDAGPDGSVDGTGGNSDTGVDSESIDTSLGPMGDSGEPCIQPGDICDPGLYCAGGQTCEISSCAKETYRPLPYNIASDFDTVYTIGLERDNLKIIPSGADCNATTYPPIENTGLGDSGSPVGDAGDAGDAGYPTLEDGGVQISTYSPAQQPPCYEFLYDPSCLSGTNGLCWAGAIFTDSMATALASPGAMPTAGVSGVCIATGATGISFWARSSLNGSIVKFGSSRAGACMVETPILEADGGPPDITTQQMLCPGDTEFYLQLTTEWRQYWVSLPVGEPYDDEVPGAKGGGVWSALSVVVEPEYFVGGGYIFIKDVVWSNATDGFDAGVTVSTGSDAGDAGDAGVMTSNGSDAGDGAVSDAKSD